MALDSHSQLLTNSNAVARLYFDLNWNNIILIKMINKTRLQFFYNFIFSFLCKKCKINYDELYIQHEIIFCLFTRKNLLRYLYDVTCSKTELYS